MFLLCRVPSDAHLKTALLIYSDAKYRTRGFERREECSPTGRTVNGVVLADVSNEEAAQQASGIVKPDPTKPNNGFRKDTSSFMEDMTSTVGEKGGRDGAGFKPEYEDAVRQT